MTPSSLSCVLALVVAAVSACGPKNPDGGGGRGGGGGGGGGSGSATAPATLSEDECTTMIHHMIDVQLEEKYANDPDGKPLPEQVDKIKAEQAGAGKAECVAKFDRKTFDCVIAANTVAALADCAK
jgi:hypothetical protein